MTRRFSRLLIAGGAGFIGSNFVRRLRRRRPGTELWVLDKLTYAGNPANLADVEGGPGYRFVRGDVCDEALVDELAGNVDAIVNFAAETHVDRSLADPFAFVTTNVLGTAVLCESARRHRHRVFLLVSTDEVYGHVAEGRSCEDDALRPRSPYAASKAGAEHLARAFAVSHGLPLLVVRGSNSYGPYQHPEKVVPLFITNAIDDLPLPLYGSGGAVRDYLHVEDQCHAIDLVLHQAPAGATFNVGTGVATSGVELAGLLCELMEKPRSLLQHVADRRGHDYRYALDSGKIRALGWAPSIDLRAGLAGTVRWYRRRQDWWRPLKSGAYRDYWRRTYRPAAGGPAARRGAFDPGDR